MDLERAARWMQLRDKADEVFIMWFRLKDKQLAQTFWTWYLRLIHEGSSIGMDVDEVWKLRR